MKKQTKEVWVYRGTFILLGLVALTGYAFATGTFSWSNVEKWAGEAIANKVESPAVEVNAPLGAVPGQDFPGPSMSFGGVKFGYQTVSMTLATTTLCSMRINATSSLSNFRFYIPMGTTTAAATLFLATTTNASGIGTSTSNAYSILATTTVAVSSAKSWAWFPMVRLNGTGEPNSGQEQLMIYPNSAPGTATSTFLILGAQPGSYTTGWYFPGGKCYAEFGEF